MGQVTIQYSFENAEDLSPGQLQMDSVLDSGERVKGVSYWKVQITFFLVPNLLKIYVYDILHFIKWLQTKT